MDEALLAIASIPVVRKAIESLISDLIALAKNQAASTFAQWKASNAIRHMSAKLKYLRFVKTLWQFEKEVDIADFYYPCKIRIGDSRRPIQYLDAIDFAGSIVFRGIVGQGKSIFCRYLAAKEYERGKRLPLFLELRRIQEGDTLMSYIQRELDSLNLPLKNGAFVFLAKNGRLILFLDGFDEVNEHKRGALITEIELLIRTYEQLRIIVTARPNSGIEHSALLRVYDLSPLEGSEYEDVIRRIHHDSKVADQIIDGLQGRRHSVTTLLTTPLMITLLVFRYQCESSIPENVVAFYENLFPLLLHRHDKSKAGYVRPRKSALGDNALQDIFSALCYVTRKSGRGAFSIAELDRMTKEALLLSGITGDSEAVIEDFIKITCLILEEAGECRFLHKSVQEYYAATFIWNQTEQAGRDFYERVREKWGSWQGELAYLEHLDRYRYGKSFALPEVKKLLGLGDTQLDEEWKPSDELIERIYRHDILGYSIGGSGEMSVLWSSHSESWALHRVSQVGLGYAGRIFSEIDWKEIANLVKAGKIEYRKVKRTKDENINVTISALLEITGIGAKLKAILADELLGVHEEALALQASIQRSELNREAMKI